MPYILLESLTFRQKLKREYGVHYGAKLENSSEFSIMVTMYYTTNEKGEKDD